MAIDNRKTLVTNLPPNRGFNMTIYIPCFQLYPPPPPPQPPQTSTETDLSLLVTTMICIVGSLFLFLFLLALIHLFRVKQSGRSSAAEVTLGNTNRREDEDEAEERDDHRVWRINTSGLQRSVIDSITVVGFKKGQGTIKCTECSVCLNEFQEDESLRLLPKCSHAFHINCIDTWFQSHKNCPLCRAPVLLNEVSHKETETNHQSLESRSSNGGGEEESSGTRNVSVVLSRTQSDLVNNCGGSGSVETVRRSFSIGGSEVNRSRRHFYSSFSANFFSSSRRSRNQEPVLPTRMPSVSD